MSNYFPLISSPVNVMQPQENNIPSLTYTAHQTHRTIPLLRLTTDKQRLIHHQGVVLLLMGEAKTERKVSHLVVRLAPYVVALFFFLRGANLFSYEDGPLVTFGNQASDISSRQQTCMNQSRACKHRKHRGGGYAITKITKTKMVI